MRANAILRGLVIVFAATLGTALVAAAPTGVAAARSTNGLFAASQPASNSWIIVTTATYGASCGLPDGNVTQALKAACDGKRTCVYRVNLQVLGDPAPGCRKDFSVQWSCGGGSGGSSYAPAEAGLGSKVSLFC